MLLHLTHPVLHTVVPLTRHHLDVCRASAIHSQALTGLRICLKHPSGPVWHVDLCCCLSSREICCTSRYRCRTFVPAMRAAKTGRWIKFLSSTATTGIRQAHEGDAAPSSMQDQPGPTKPWLPCFISISSEPGEWRVDVKEAATLDEVVRATATSGQPPPPGSIRSACLVVV